MHASWRAKSFLFPLQKAESFLHPQSHVKCLFIINLYKTGLTYCYANGTVQHWLKRSLSVLWAIDSHGNQRTFTKQNCFQKQKSFSFSIFMQVICCAMSPYSVVANQVYIHPPPPSLSLSLPLSESVNLFPNCKLSAGAKAFFLVMVKYEINAPLYIE